MNLKIAVIGGTGNAGSRIVNEALSRGHEVTLISRHCEDRAEQGLRCVACDAGDTAAIAEVLGGHDAVVSAIKFKMLDTQKLIDAVRQSGAKRYAVVGGAGSLQLRPGVLEMEGEHFPDVVKEEAGKGATFLDQLRQAPDLEWTFLSPSRLFLPGERTGFFRKGKDSLLFDDEGQSRISMEDYAVALIDELEQPEHVRERFTVGY